MADEEFTKKCRGCKAEKKHSEFYSHPENRDGRAVKCKACYEIEREAKRLAVESQGRTKPCIRCKGEFPATVEFFYKHRQTSDGLLNKCRDCTVLDARVTNKRHRDTWRLTVLTHYGREGRLECCCCGESHEEFLQLDHINGGGVQDRKAVSGSSLWYRIATKERFPTGKYETLCANCNFAKGIKGGCPHKRASHLRIVSAESQTG